MAFLNALGTVRRVGQWRLRLVLRASLPDGRTDLSDAGLLDFAAASAVLLTVSPRPPLDRCRFGGCGADPSPVLSASSADGSLLIANPGIVEASFPLGWSACIPPGLYDVRVLVTVGPETGCVFDEPVELR